MEKRNNHRIPKRLFVKFGIEQTNAIGFTGDISRNGLFIKTNTVYPPDTQLLIQLVLPDDREIDMAGRVMWAKRVNPSMIRHVKKNGMGVQLDRVPEDYSRFLKSIDHD